jgi:hypothetical protein
MSKKKFDARVWGPPYWFFLHTVAHTYPLVPNAVTKRKYYDLIQNMPLFLPDAEMGNRFSTLLDLYPVSPYLDCRDSFIRWVHFIHNKVSVSLGEEEMTLSEGLERYLDHYNKPVPQALLIKEPWRIKEHWLSLGMILTASLVIYFAYKTG